MAGPGPWEQRKEKEPELLRGSVSRSQGQEMQREKERSGWPPGS